ncbi:a-factor receptor [Serendipita sp. 411]|nr:a-factor receptor [Serendipita sp. 400]KAG8858594.1 a-factor receptor [Serendipita sp. 411]
MDTLGHGDDDPPVIASGLSHAFPALQILCVISIILCLLLFPGFMRTRIFSLVYYIWWIVAGNGLLLVNTCIWRGATYNAPVYSDIVARFWDIYSIALYMCILCMNKFIWTISRPAPSIKVYDGRRRANLLDFFLCVGVPFLLLPVSFFIGPVRYSIIEDIGPWYDHSLSVDTFIIFVVPIIVISMICIVYSCLACYNFWHSRHEQLSANDDTTVRHQRRALSTSQRWRYTLISLVTISGVTFGAIWVCLPYIQFTMDAQGHDPCYKVIGLIENKDKFKQVKTLTRDTLERSRIIQNITGFVYTVPCIGISLFLCYGIVPELRKNYVEWIRVLRIENLWTVVRAYAKRLGWRREGTGMDPYVHSPFQTDDIVLEDISTPQKPVEDEIAKGLPMPPPPTAPPPTPSSSSGQSRSMPTTSPTAFRKHPLSGVVHPPESNNLHREQGKFSREKGETPFPRVAVNL